MKIRRGPGYDAALRFWRASHGLSLSERVSACLVGIEELSLNTRDRRRAQSFVARRCHEYMEPPDEVPREEAERLRRRARRESEELRLR